MGNTNEASFSDGKLDGIAKYYDRNGKIMAERSYKNGQLTGVSREYHPNEKVKKEIELTAGNLLLDSIENILVVGCSGGNISTKTTKWKEVFANSPMEK